MENPLLSSMSAYRIRAIFPTIVSRRSRAEADGKISHPLVPRSSHEATETFVMGRFVALCEKTDPNEVPLDHRERGWRYCDGNGTQCSGNHWKREGDSSQSFQCLEGFSPRNCHCTSFHCCSYEQPRCASPNTRKVPSAVVKAMADKRVGTWDGLPACLQRIGFQALEKV